MSFVPPDAWKPSQSDPHHRHADWRQNCRNSAAILAAYVKSATGCDKHHHQNARLSTKTRTQVLNSLRIAPEFHETQTLRISEQFSLQDVKLHRTHVELQVTLRQKMHQICSIFSTLRTKNKQNLIANTLSQDANRDSNPYFAGLNATWYPYC
jgi:hypothetical protein